MENLIIEGKNDTYFTPKIEFHAASGKCSISGESYLEEPFEFYQKISNWLKRYLSEGTAPLVLDMKLSYFNTSSSRALLEMFRMLKEKKEAGKNITVNWFYPDPDDEEMLQEGEDFIVESGLDINLLKYGEGKNQ